MPYGGGLSSVLGCSSGRGSGGKQQHQEKEVVVAAVVFLLVLSSSTSSCGCAATLISGSTSALNSGKGNALNGVSNLTNSIINSGGAGVSDGHPLQQRQQKIGSAISNSNIINRDHFHQTSPTQQQLNNINNKYIQQAPLHFSSQNRNPSDILKDIQGGNSAESNNYIYSQDSYKAKPSARLIGSLRYQNSRLRSLSKRSQRKHLKQKRHTLLALVRAAIPLQQQRLQSLPSRRFHHKPSALLASLTPEQQEFILSQQQEIFNQQEHDTPFVQEEQQTKHEQEQKLLHYQQQEAIEAAQGQQQQHESPFDPYQQVHSSPGASAAQITPPETVYGPWLRKRSGVIGSLEEAATGPLGRSSISNEGTKMVADQGEIREENENDGVITMSDGVEDETLTGNNVVDMERNEGGGQVVGGDGGEGDTREGEHGDEFPGQEEVNMGLQQVGNSINHAFFRSARSGARPYDVPQIGE